MEMKHSSLLCLLVDCWARASTRIPIGDETRGGVRRDQVPFRRPNRNMERGESVGPLVRPWVCNTLVFSPTRSDLCCVCTFR